MPVQGPDYSKTRADEVYAELLALLESKHKLLTFPLDIHDAKIWGPGREEAKAKLKEAVHAIFLQDCYESW